ncbi:MAG: class I SAM-dependent methyltransferase [Kiritimatiellae bacterium]|nr:class I SAM-dependent methyltransferase [Kiritimatiellia bacterium]
MEDILTNTKAPDRIRSVRRLGAYHGRWLDIGFGEGDTMRMAHRMGYAVGGVEESALAVGHMKDLLPTGRWMSLKEFRASPPRREFEIVSLYHVLEHVIDFRPAIAAAADALVPGGLLVVEVPYFYCLQAKLRPARWQWAVEHHVNFFTKKNLMTLFEECDCELTAVERRYHLNTGSTKTVAKRVKLAVKRALAKIGFGQAIAVYGRRR